MNNTRERQILRQYSFKCILTFLVFANVIPIFHVAPFLLECSTLSRAFICTYTIDVHELNEDICVQITKQSNK